MTAGASWEGRRFVRTPATAPGPVGPQMLKAFSAIRRNPLAYLDSVWREYGDVVQFPIPKPPSYLVNDPEGVRRVLVANGRNYGKSTIQYRSLSLVTGEGLLVADTEAWRRQRPLVQPAFHHETLEHIVSHVDVAVQRMLARWDVLAAGRRRRRRRGDDARRARGGRACAVRHGPVGGRGPAGDRDAVGARRGGGAGARAGHAAGLGPDAGQPPAALRPSTSWTAPCAG